MENVVLTTPTQLESLIEKAVLKVFLEHTPQYCAKPSTEKEILNADEAAELLNLAKQTIYSLTSKRTIPHFKKQKLIYFKRSELLKWIEDGEQKTVAAMQQDNEQPYEPP